MLWLLAQIVLVTACILGNTHPSPEQTALGIFFMVFPAGLMAVVAFIRGGRASPVAVLPAPGGQAGAAAISMSMPGGEAAGAAAMAPVALPSVVATVPPAASAAGMSVAEVLTHSRNFVLAGLGWLLLMAAFVLGLGVAVDMPGMIAAGIPEPQLAETLNQEAQGMQVEDWQRLMRAMLVLVGGVGMFLALVFLMMSRRSAGAVHMIRSIVGVSGVIGALALLNAGLAGHWVAVRIGPGPGMPPAPGDVVGLMVPQVPVMGPVSVPASIDAFLNQAHGGAVFFAAVVMVAAMTFLFWPASRRQAFTRA